MGILLAFISVILLYILSPLLIIYSIFAASSFKSISDHFYKIAVSIDQLGNVIGSDLFNDIMISKDGFKFGNEDETISSVLGRNYKTNTLKTTGKILRWTLDKIQPNHCVNSIGN